MEPQDALHVPEADRAAFREWTDKVMAALGWDDSMVDRRAFAPYFRTGASVEDMVRASKTPLPAPGDGSAAPAGADPGVLDDIRDLVMDACPEAECVVLFGSRAAGTARPDSDYDVLVVVPDDGDLTPEETQDFLYGRASGGLRAPVDLTVATLAEIAADPSSVAHAAYRDGTVLSGER